MYKTPQNIENLHFECRYHTYNMFKVNHIINGHHGQTVFLYLEVLLTGHWCDSGNHMGIGNN